MDIRQGCTPTEDSCWVLDVQLVVLARNAYCQLRLAYQLQTFLEKKDLVTCTHALVIYRLNYHHVLWVGLPLQITGKL